MQLAWIALLIVVLRRLVSVGAAFGECAWVLWEVTSVKQPRWAFWRAPDKWSMLGAMPTDGSCMTALREAQARSVRTWTKYVEKIETQDLVFETERRGIVSIVEKGGQGGSSFTLGRSLHWSEHRCLPDTVDSRGSKGR